MKYLKMILVMVFCFGFVQLLFGQPDTLWTKKIKDHDACSILEDKADGLIISTYPKWVDDSTSKCILLSINSEGAIAKQNEFTFIKPPIDCFRCSTWISRVELNRFTNDNLILVGKLMIGGGGAVEDAGIILKKVNSNSDILFEKVYGHSNGDYHDNFCTSQDGGFMLTTRSGEIQKFDTNGDSVWATYPVQGFDYYHNPHDLIETHDGVLMIYSEYVGNDIYPLRIVKIDFDGNVLWNEVLQDTLSGDYILKCKTNDKGFLYLTNYINLTRLDSSGSIISKTKLKVDPIDFEKKSINAMNQTSDGGIITLATDYSNDDNFDLIATKYSIDGVVLWSKRLDSGYMDRGKYIIETSDKGYLIVGTDIYSDNHKIWIVKLEPYLTGIDYFTTTPSSYSLSQNYPNPFNPSTTIKFTLPKSEFVELKVYNILGKEVANLVSNKLNQGSHTYQFDGMNLASGIYYYQIVAGEFREVNKMILLK